MTSSQSKAIAKLLATYHALPSCEDRDDGGDLYCTSRATFTHIALKGDVHLYVCAKHSCKRYCQKGIR